MVKPNQHSNQVKQGKMEMYFNAISSVYGYCVGCKPIKDGSWLLPLTLSLSLPLSLRVIIVKHCVLVMFCSRSLFTLCVITTKFSPLLTRISSL